MDRLPDHVDQELLTEEFNRLVQGLVSLFVKMEARERARGICGGCCLPCPARTPGKWPKRLAIPRLLAFRTCWVALPDRLINCGIIFGTMQSAPLRTVRRC